VARKVVKEKRARIWKKNPPAIMLPIGEVELPAFVARRKEMQANPVTNWLKYFEKERDIWLQNVSATQISMQFEVANGQFAGTLIPVGSDPFHLTQAVPWDAIKRSLDFRRLMNKVPTVMRVMTEEEVQAHYTKRAEQLGFFIEDGGHRIPDTNAAIQHIEAERDRAKRQQLGEPQSTKDANGQVRFTPPRTAQELMQINQAADVSQPNPAEGFSNLGDKPIQVGEVVAPRVTNLCHQVSTHIPANQQMPADVFFRALQEIEMTLTETDLQYIESSVKFPTVKKWARRLMESRQKAAMEQDMMMEDDGLSLPPSMAEI